MLGAAADGSVGAHAAAAMPFRALLSVATAGGGYEDEDGGDSTPVNVSHSSCHFPADSTFASPRPAAVTWAMLVASLLSMFLCAAVARSYYKYKMLQRHPNDLIVARSVYDGILSFNFAILSLQSLLKPESEYVAGMAICTFWAVIVQWVLLASEALAFCLALDLLLGLSNPFTDYAWNSRVYKVACATLGAVDALALLALQDTTKPGHCILGSNNPVQVCWINWQHGRSEVNPYTSAFFYAPVFLLNMGSIGITLFPARKRLASGLRETASARLGVFRTTLVAAVTFTAYYIVLFPLYLYTLSTGVDAPVGVLALFGAGIGLRGSVTALVWWLTADIAGARRRHARRRAAAASQSDKQLDVFDDDDNYMPRLYKALREEVMFYTAFGVMRAVDHVEHLVRSGGFPGASTHLTVPRTRERVKRFTLLEMLSMTTRGASRRRGHRNRKRSPSDSSQSSAHTDASHDALSAALGETSSLLGSSRPGGDGAVLTSAGTINDSAPATRSMRTPTVSMRQALLHGMSAHHDEDEDREDEEREVGSGAGDRYWDGMRDMSTSSTGHSGGGTPVGAGLLHGTTASMGGHGVTDTFAFEDVEPMVFRRVRSILGIDRESYLASIEKLEGGHVTEGGASGSFMFYTHDKKYIIKTVSVDEYATLRQLASSYADFLNSNPNSLLTRFLGCHCITMYSHKVYFIVMQNVLHTALKLHDLYDLKGSTFNRNAMPKAKGSLAYCRHCEAPFRVGVAGPTCKRQPGRPHEPWRVLKDNDLNFKLRLGSKTNVITTQIRSDCDWLRRHHVMDYSLLVGVHRARFKLTPVRLNEHEAPRMLARVVGSSPQKQKSTYYEAQRLGRSTTFNSAAGSSATRDARAGSSVSRAPPVTDAGEGRDTLGTPLALGATMEGGGLSDGDGGTAIGGALGGGPDADGLRAGDVEYKAAEDGGEHDSGVEGGSDSVAGSTGGASGNPDEFAAAAAASDAGVSRGGRRRPAAGRGGPGAVHSDADAGSVVSYSDDVLEAADEPMRECDRVLHGYSGGMRAHVVEGPEVYFMGIVDVLKRWGPSTRLERVAKVYVRRQPADAISCLEPGAYADRFVRWINDTVIDAPEGYL